MYLFTRVGTRTGTPCTVLCLVSPGNVPICPCSYSYWYPLNSVSLGQHGQCTYLPVFILVLCVNRCTVCTVLVPLVQCFARSARAMYLFARVRTRTGTLYSASLGQHGQCTYLPVFVLVLVPLVQCFAWTARAMYLFARSCIFVQCFVMGNPSHVRILVFGLSRCALKKNQNTPRPSEHSPVMGEKMSKRLGGIKRLQIQNLFMAFKQVPRCRYHWVHSIMSGRNPPLYCTFTLIAMQGHQKNIKSKPETM